MEDEGESYSTKSFWEAALLSVPHLTAKMNVLGLKTFFLLPWGLHLDMNIKSSDCGANPDKLGRKSENKLPPGCHSVSRPLMEYLCIRIARQDAL